MNYFIIVNGAQQGPYTIEELRQRHIDSATLVWTEGMAQWTPAWQVEDLRTLFNGNADNGLDGIPTPPPMPGDMNGTGYNNAAGNAFAAGNAQYAQGPTQATAANQQGTKPAKKSMKVGTWILAAVVALLLVMAMTNPSRDAHKQTVKQNITNGVEKGLSQSEGESSDNPFQAFGTAMIKALATPFVNAAIDNMLQYHNYLFWSTTTIDLPDTDSDSVIKAKSVRTSLGIFGKVFTSDEDDVAKAISNVVNDGNSTSDQSAVTDNTDDNTDAPSATDNVDDNTDDFASQVTDSVLSIGTKVGKNVAKQVGHKVGQQIKKEIRQNTDSTTASGLNKIVDAVESFLKGL